MIINIFESEKLRLFLLEFKVKNKKGVKMSARSSASKRTQIKLSYFNSNGRASTARLILAVANVKYDDERLDVSR